MIQVKSKNVFFHTLTLGGMTISVRNVFPRSVWKFGMTSTAYERHWVRFLAMEKRQGSFLLIEDGGDRAIENVVFEFFFMHFWGTDKEVSIGDFVSSLLIWYTRIQTPVLNLRHSAESTGQTISRDSFLVLKEAAIADELLARFDSESKTDNRYLVGWRIWSIPNSFYQ